MSEKRQPKRVLFVWDRTLAGLNAASRIVSRDPEMTVVSAVHVMPHESIYSYGTVYQSKTRQPYVVQELNEEFAWQLECCGEWKDVRLEILFGDRITEICRFAKSRRADLIVMPRFRQSRFSNWIHGDLNQLVVQKAPCGVCFLEDKSLLGPQDSRFSAAIPPH